MGKQDHSPIFFLEEGGQKKSWAIQDALDEAGKGVRPSVMKQYDASLRLRAGEAYEQKRDVVTAVRQAIENILARKRDYGARQSTLPVIRGEKRRGGREPGSGKNY